MPVDEEDDGMSASSSDMSSVAVRVYAEDDDMSEDEADGEDSKEESSESGAEESKEEAAEKEMDAGADETKAEEMDAEPQANGADAEKTKVEAADAKVEAEEQAAEAGGEIEEDGADSDAEGEGTDAVEESPPPSPPARSSRSRKAEERGDSPPPVPDNLRCRRSDGKKWRCAARALPTVSFCEYHYAKASKGKKPPADSEVLAVALQRQKKNKRKGRRRLNLTPESPKATKDLPNGLMPISPGSSGAVGSPVTTKVGVDIPAPIRRCYRSKNADPVPVCPVKVVPRAMSKAKEAQMSCHRCGLKKVARVVKCNNCENNCFCNRCINKWYYGISRKDMKMKCPVCRGSCDCKRCTLGQTKGAMHKESPSDLGSSGAVCSPVMTKVTVDSVQANDYSIKRCISALTATTLAPDEKIKASEVFQTLAYRETFLSFNETDPEIALLWLRGKVDKL